MTSDHDITRTAANRLNNVVEEVFAVADRVVIHGSKEPAGYKYHVIEVEVLWIDKDRPYKKDAVTRYDEVAEAMYRWHDEDIIKSMGLDIEI